MPAPITIPALRRVVTASALLLIGSLVVTPPLPSQLPTTSFALTFPGPCQTAIRDASASGGVAWTMIRRCGLSLTVKGQGEFSVAVVAVVVSKGRIIRSWTSPKRQVSTGTFALSGKDFMPGDGFLEGVPNVLGEQAGVPVDDARRAISGTADAAPLLGRISSSTNGVIFVLIPDAGGRSTTTSPRFARTEKFGD